MRMGARGNVLSRIKYPKLLLLVLSYGIAFVIFAEKSYAPLHDTLVFLVTSEPFWHGSFMLTRPQLRPQLQYC